MTDRGVIFNNLAFQKGANATYQFKVDYDAATGQTYQYRSDWERMQSKLGKVGLGQQYEPNLYCRFYNITSGVIPNFYGPPGADWGTEKGTPGAYPINFNNGFPGTSTYFNTGVIAKGYIYTPVATTVQLRTVSDDGVAVFLNGVPVINNWTNHSSTTDTSAVLQLIPGYTPVEVRYFNGGVDGVLQLSYNLGGSGFNQNNGVLYNTACSR